MKELGHRFNEKWLKLLHSAEINTLFAVSVLEDGRKGKVFADDEDNPSSIYIRNNYGMSLIYGDALNQDYIKELRSYLLNLDKERVGIEWLQVYPHTLGNIIEDILGNDLLKKSSDEAYNPLVTEENNKVLEFQRINYLFNHDRFISMNSELKNGDYQILVTPKEVYNHTEGSVIPKVFWNDYEDFIHKGMGFTVLAEDNTPASTAFASFVIGNKLEIGIETNENMRGAGYGTKAGAALIEYCLKNDFEPVWSCHSGNIKSRKLAEKLGFEEIRRIPYYRLPV